MLFLVLHFRLNLLLVGLDLHHRGYEDLILDVDRL
jgi:hypothetical protein